jgi:hypothetical protein
VITAFPPHATPTNTIHHCQVLGKSGGARSADGQRSDIQIDTAEAEATRVVLLQRSVDPGGGGEHEESQIRRNLGCDVKEIPIGRREAFPQDACPSLRDAADLADTGRNLAGRTVSRTFAPTASYMERRWVRN